jgi:hypothetical protein
VCVVALPCCPPRTKHATSAGTGFEGVLTDALSHLAILLARLRGVPIAVGGDQILLSVERMSDTFAALTPRLPPEAQTPLQCEINRLGRIGSILFSPIDVVAELELLLQVGEFFNCFGVSLDRVLDNVESVALN